MTLLFVLPEITKSQNYIYDYKRILVTPFLADNDVIGIAEDSNGYIWLSTINHIYRYDGNSMEQVEIPNKKSSQTNIVFKKIVIYNDCLYILSNLGIYSIETTKGLKEEAKLITSTDDEILNLESKEGKGIYWINKNNQLYNLDNKQTRFIQLPPDSINEKCNIGFEGENTVICTIGNRMFFIDNKDFLLTENIKLKVSKWVVGIHLIPNGILLTSEDHKTYIYNKNIKNVLQTDLYGKDLFDITYLNKDYITINNENQLYHHYSKNGEIQKHLISLGADKAERIHKTYLIQNKIFAATTNGLIVVNLKENSFSLIHSTFDQKYNSFDVPRGIIEDDKYYYLTTYNRIIRYDKFLKKSNIFLTNNLLSHAVFKQNDSIWIATDGNGLRNFNLTSKSLNKYNYTPKLKYNHLICISNLAPGIFLLGGYDYLLVFDQIKNEYREINLDYKRNDFSKLMISQIIKFDQHHFYLATTLGVLFANDAGQILKYFGTELNESKSLQTHAIWIDKDKSVWAGTSNGLFHFSAEGKILRHLKKEEGLSGDRIASLIPDKNNQLWVTTFTGLSSVNLSSGIINNFRKEDGLPDNEFNHGSYLLTKEGDIILGTMNGFVLFKPEHLIQNQKSQTKLKISKLEYGNIKEHKSLLNYKDIKYDTLRLGKGINYVKIQFNLYPIDIFQKSNYDYKIEGVHNDWINIGPSPILHIDNFKSGKYIIHIRARTGIGSEQIITKSMPLIVEEYFYNSNEFFILIFIIFITFLILYFSLLIRRNQKIIQIRQQIAQDLHDEVGSYLTGISMSIDMMQRKKEKEKFYYETIQKLGKKALKSLKDSIWSLDNESDNAVQLWDRVKTLAAETYAPLDISFNFKEIDGLEKINLKILEKTYLFYAIKECITNSIKHGNREKVSFFWNKKNDCHYITIINSYDPSMKKEENGNGLYNIENRMKKINASVSFHEDGQFFTVEFKLNFLL